MRLFNGKILSMLLVAALLAALFAGCAQGGTGGSSQPQPSQAESSAPVESAQPEESEEDSTPEPVLLSTANVGALKGPTGMGLAKLMDDADKGPVGEGSHKVEYNFALEGAPDVIQGKLLNGELDMAAVPTNLASVMHSVTNGEIRIIAVSSMKVLSVMQGPGAGVSSVADLAGKTLFTAGQGSTQEYVLDYLLRQNGLDPATDLTIEYKSEQAEVAALLMGGECDVALLPQPFVTTVTIQNADITKAFDVNDAWDAASGGAELAMSCIVARAAYIEENPEAVEAFLRDYAASIAYVNANVDEAAALIGGFEIVPEAVAKQAIPACNIAVVTGDAMKSSVEAYLSVLFAQNPKAVGGSLPNEGFYYLGQ